MHALQDGSIKTAPPAALAQQRGQQLRRRVDWLLVDGLQVGAGGWVRRGCQRQRAGQGAACARLPAEPAARRRQHVCGLTPAPRGRAEAGSCRLGRAFQQGQGGRAPGAAATQGGSGETYDWTQLQVPQGCSSSGWLLAGGLGPDNVAQAVTLARPTAVDVSSGVCGPDGAPAAARSVWRTRRLALARAVAACPRLRPAAGADKRPTTPRLITRGRGAALITCADHLPFLPLQA
jgi:hypothetical protein